MPFFFRPFRITFGNFISWGKTAISFDLYGKLNKVAHYAHQGRCIRCTMYIHVCTCMHHCKLLRLLITLNVLMGGGIFSPSTKMCHFFLIRSFLLSGASRMYLGGRHLHFKYNMYKSENKSVSLVDLSNMIDNYIALVPDLPCCTFLIVRGRKK